MTLRDPERCPRCAGRGRVVESKKRAGFRRRRHRCGACRLTWLSFQSVIDPRRVRQAST